MSNKVRKERRPKFKGSTPDLEKVLYDNGRPQAEIDATKKLLKEKKSTIQDLTDEPMDMDTPLMASVEDWDRTDLQTAGPWGSKKFLLPVGDENYRRRYDMIDWTK